MNQESRLELRDVYIVDGNRTPFLKAKAVGPFSGADLAVAAGQPLLNRQSFLPSQLDEVILGSVMPGPDEANIARIVALRLGCGKAVPAFTVMRNCASGMQALDTAAMHIATGRSNLILAGGTEAMSHAPLLFSQKMAIWMASWYAAKGFKQKAAVLSQFRLSYLTPVIALLKGLTDPIVGLNMGQTAEKLAYNFHISREAMDSFAVQSHQRIMKAYKEQAMSEVTPIMDKKGKVYAQDDGFREDSTVEKLSTLKPYFDKKYGMVTPANSSQVTDGACLLILASAQAVKQYNLPVIGRIVDTEWAALEPSEMGLGPVHAATPLMLRNNLTPQDFDSWEINEAFAAQVLACLAAWNDDAYCQTHFGLPKAMGAPSLGKVNREGGAIALGHPVGASGARIVLHLLKSLEKNGGTRGMATICIGGGQGGAMYVEKLSTVRE